MKKILNLFMVIMAVCFTACFVSCDSDDDNNGGGSSDSRVYVYSAYVNDNVFGLCDVSITLHSGDKSKVVKLNKSNGKLVNIDKKDFYGQFVATIPTYRFDFDNVDGSKGIDYAEAEVTLKSDAESFVNSLEPNKTFYFIACFNHTRQEYSANGQYDIEQPNTASFYDSSREKLLNEVNGTKVYETLPRLFTSSLSKRK